MIELLGDPNLRKKIFYYLPLASRYYFNQDYLSA